MRLHCLLNTNRSLDTIMLSHVLVCGNTHLIWVLAIIRNGIMSFLTLNFVMSRILCGKFWNVLEYNLYQYMFIDMTNTACLTGVEYCSEWDHVLFDT